MARFESIIVVGSSGSGKTTLVNGLRNPEYESSVNVPKRYVTRPKRLNDDLEENIHRDKEAFDKGVELGLISPHWTRLLDYGGRIVSYGFATQPNDEDDGRLKVYSANNAFLRSKNESVQNVLASGLVVITAADTDLRYERLHERSPDMAVSERDFRIQDNTENSYRIHGPEQIIDTTDFADEEGQARLQKIVDLVLADKTP